MVDRGKIGSGPPGSNAAIVLSESDVQNPVQAVFHLPVVSDVTGHLFRIAGN